MSKRTFKRGDRVMTSSTAHEPYYGTVVEVYAYANAAPRFLVEWDVFEGAEDYTSWEFARHLNHAPKLPVKMVAVKGLKVDGKQVYVKKDAK